MKDICTYYLFVEIMSRYSNIIFTDADFTIFDAVKRIPLNEDNTNHLVMHGAKYEPLEQGKESFLTSSFDFMKDFKGGDLHSFILDNITGFSGITVSEIIARCGFMNDGMPTLNEEELNRFKEFINKLKNITEQIAVVEQERNISKAILLSYLQYVPEEKMPALVSTTSQTADTISDRELLLKALSMGQMINELRNEIQDLRTLVATIAGGKLDTLHIDNSNTVIATAAGAAPEITHLQVHKPSGHLQPTWDEEIQESEVIDDEPLALTSRERTAIIKALARHNGKRKLAAAELGISERTLYRKIKDYDIDA